MSEPRKSARTIGRCYKGIRLLDEPSSGSPGDDIANTIVASAMGKYGYLDWPVSVPLSQSRRRWFCRAQQLRAANFYPQVFAGVRDHITLPAALPECDWAVIELLAQLDDEDRARLQQRRAPKAVANSRHRRPVEPSNSPRMRVNLGRP
jgi:hypothetical protein